MNAGSIIDGWKQRLTTLAENPPYVFRDTPSYLIALHRKRLTTFAGYSESQVSQAEARLGSNFPTIFRTYLREIARSRGDLFRGSDVAGIEEFEQFRTNALTLMAETCPVPCLPPKAVVFLFHQGYQFEYLLANGGFDGPTMMWTETELEPRQVAATFSEMIEAELKLMEDVNRASRESGGYYLTLHWLGGSTQTHPALASGERPLGHAVSNKWWQFWR